ncbi:MAG: glutaredoxin family protein [Deltaproteobacteria bacterium]|nr:glutaredoxin family protein [Deltaproteobacteria bacterium]
MPKITLFSREECHLCEVAYDALVRVKHEVPFELVVCDLDREAPPDKRAAYDWEVPVVELEGRKIMKYTVDEARLRRLLSLAEP